jgi:conjugative transfer region lipoprotein (TIGR03751 family)
MVDIKHILIGALLVATVTGCSSTKSEKDKIIPKSDKTTEQVYDEQVAASLEKTQAFRNMVSMRPATEQEVLAKPYEINAVGRPEFKTLPNPTLYLYFPATISTDGRMPIPAWMTEFKMYDRDEYAGHGEIAIGSNQ